MPKKILHISHTDIQSDSRILKEISSLKKCEKYNLFAIGVNDPQGEKRVNSDIKITSLNIRSRNIPFIPKIIKYLLVTLEISLKIFFLSINKKIDLIHCHDTTVLPVGVLLKFFKRNKVIYDAHELESNRNGLGKTAGKLTLWVEKMLWPFIDGFITVSPSIESWYIKQIGLKESKVILNSPDINLAQKQSYYFKEKFNISNNFPTIIYVGILGKGRGIELILDVFKAHDFQLNLIFLGYGPLTETIKEITKNYSNIYYHDAVKHFEVVSITSSADYGLCMIENISLSDYYCLPNKLFEYAFSGVKVLASDFPDIKNIVEQYNLGLCFSNDYSSLYNALKLIESERFETPKTKDINALSWEYQSTKLLDFYKKILDK